jgi:5-methyltetrahydrofolate--homocysteine methyltransferase
VDQLQQIAEALERGERETVRRLVDDALAAGTAAATILDHGLLAGMAVVGRRFREHEIFLPDVLLAARAMYAGLDPLEPLLAGERAATRGRVVLGTVAGDQHDIGKNLVGIMLRGAGYEVVDLGVDVPPARFAEAAMESGASVVGVSALLTTTMPAMAEVVRAVRERDPARRIRVIVGGAPVTAEYARSIGADGYGTDASRAVDQVRAMLEADAC